MNDENEMNDDFFDGLLGPLGDSISQDWEEYRCRVVNDLVIDFYWVPAIEDPDEIVESKDEPLRIPRGTLLTCCHTYPHAINGETYRYEVHVGPLEGVSFGDWREHPKIRKI